MLIQRKGMIKMSNVLECKDIVKKFKEKEALKGVSLSLEKGKIYGMIGRNGAGKTTLLSIMSAQSKPTKGSVNLDGEDVWENQKCIDNICFSRELNPLSSFGPNNVKVKELLKMAAIYYPHWDKQMADSLVKEFDLNVKQKISKLSKGMLSMVTIIIALASKSEFTILDEPVAGLDVVAREQFYKLLLDEYNATGRTFVISTHIIEEAADLFEEVIIVRDGNILLKENTMDLLERAYHVSGAAAEVDELTARYEAHHIENIGRSKGAALLLNSGERLEVSQDVMVQPMSLQNLFVALCGKE